MVKRNQGYLDKKVYTNTMKKKTTYREQFIKNMEGKNIRITTTEDIRSRTPVEFICNVCGESYVKTAYYLKGLEIPCTACSLRDKQERHRKKVPKLFRKRFKDLGLDKDFEIVTIPEIIKETAEFRHKRCNRVIATTLQNLSRTVKTGSSGCKYCSKTHTYSKTEVDEYIKSNLPIYELVDVYMSDRHNLTAVVRHKRCGATLHKVFNTLLNRSSGCPDCNISGGEELVKYNLKELNEPYVHQATFEGLMVVGTSRLKKVDFYLPEKGIVIEYDGRHHYESIEKWGGGEYLKHNQENDDETNKFLKNKGIKIYRIPYTVINRELLDTIEQIVKSPGNVEKYLV